MDERDPTTTEGVLVAAAELFERFGPGRVSIEAIARRCGVDPAEVRARHATPSCLLAAIVARFHECFPRCLAEVGPACWNGSGENGGHTLADRVLAVRPGGDGPDGPSASRPAPRRSRLGDALDLCLAELGPVGRVALMTDDLAWLRDAVRRVRGVLEGKPHAAEPARARRRTPTPPGLRVRARAGESRRTVGSAEAPARVKHGDGAVPEEVPAIGGE